MTVMTAEREAEVLEDLLGLARAHVHDYRHIGRTGENKFTGACSCGQWATAQPGTAMAVRRAFDRHLEQVYFDLPQAICFCLRRCFESPTRPGRFVHADWLHEFYGHDPVILDQARPS